MKSSGTAGKEKGMTGFRPITILSHPAYLQHDTGGGEHPEVPARMTAILDRLTQGPLQSVIGCRRPPEAERRLILAVHDESYLFRFEEAALSGRSYLGHPDNQMGYESYRVAQLAAGAGPAGIDLLEQGNTRHAFCCVRPPGHHAERAVALGFCFFNNVAIAARYWQERYGRRKIAIIDWDAHHGNGIQAAFEEDPEVLYISMHEHPTFSFPGTGYAEETGTGAGKGTTLNIPLLPGADDGKALAAVVRHVEPALARFRPEAIIIAAGFDGHRLDDMSGLAFSSDLYRLLGTYAAAWGEQYGNGKVLSVLEGGYHLESLADGVEQYLLGYTKKRKEE